MSGNNTLPRLEISTEIANENAENFRKWTRAFEIYLLASAMEKTDDKRKIALMLHSMGERGLHIFNSFSLELDKVTFKEVKQKFIDYFEPRKNITMARHKFFTLKQGVNESLENFIMELENAGNACEFGALRESLIRDMLIVNMTSSYAQVCQKLLQEPDLSLDRAKLLCRTLTMAQKNQESIKTTEPKESGTVYKLHKNHSPKTSGHHGRRKSRSPSRQFHRRPTAAGAEEACRRCGRSHAPRKCPAWNQKCRSCLKIGHFANVCFKKRNVRNVNVISDNICLNDDKEVSSNMAERYFLGSLFNLNAKQQGNVINKNSKSNSWHYFLKINNIMVDCIIDTGADINMMSVDVFNKFNVKMSTKDIELCKNYKIFAFGGHKVPIISVCKLKCVLDNRSEEHISFVITSLNCPTVIGLPTCIKLSLICKNFNIRSESECSNIVTQYNDVFQGLGCLPYEHSSNLKKDAQPVYWPSPERCRLR